MSEPRADVMAFYCAPDDVRFFRCSISRPRSYVRIRVLSRFVRVIINKFEILGFPSSPYSSDYRRRYSDTFYLYRFACHIFYLLFFTSVFIQWESDHRELRASIEKLTKDLTMNLFYRGFRFAIRTKSEGRHRWFQTARKSRITKLHWKSSPAKWN